jgi:hypothetical protein
MISSSSSLSSSDDAATADPTDSQLTPLVIVFEFIFFYELSTFILFSESYTQGTLRQLHLEKK